MIVKKQILFKNILIFLGCLFLIKPTCISYVMGNAINSLYSLLSIATCALTIVVYINRRKLSIIVLMITMYYAYQVVLTLYTDGDVKSISITALQFVSLCLFSEICIDNDKLTFVEMMTLLLEIYIYLNLITIIMYPGGMYSTVSTNNPSNWFLGYKNQMINYMLPAIGIELINYYYNDRKEMFSKKVRLYALLSCVVLTSIIMWSAATLIILFIVLIYMMFHKKLNVSMFNFRNYLIFNVLMTFSIVVLRLQNIFSFIIVDVLKKDITLTGRVYIWDRVLEYISQNFIFGYGVEDYTQRLIKMQIGNMPWLNNYAALHCHCRFLEVFYRGGIILFFIYLVIIIIATKKLMKYKNTIYSKVLSITLFAYLTGMMTEWYDYSPLFFVLLVMAGYSYKFIGDENISIER